MLLRSPQGSAFDLDQVHVPAGKALRSVRHSKQSIRPAAASLTLARRLAQGGLRGALVLQTCRTIARLIFAVSLAIVIGDAVQDRPLSVFWLVAAGACLAATAGIGLLTDVFIAWMENGVTNRLRCALRDSLNEMPVAQVRSRPPGQIIAGLQRYPHALAQLVIGHKAARANLTIATVLSAAAIATVCWPAALTLLLSLPVLIVFFILLGSAIRRQADVQQTRFGQLAGQFADRIRTLPTILANHAVDIERDKVAARMEAYASSTMTVLRLAFMNSGLIDFFSALSIAVLAVFLGLGHLGLVTAPGFSGLDLWQSLLVLVIAADFFTPFRRYAEQYHLKAEGEAAAKDLDWYFDGNEVRGRICSDTLAALSKLPKRPHGLAVISGPSGAGKSTLLRAAAGIGASPVGPLGADVSWISTDIYIPEGTLADAIAWNRTPSNQSIVEDVARSVGLLDERFLAGGRNATITAGGTNLSGGQRIRIGVARALLSDGTIFADEPTAKLDPETADLVRRTLIDAAQHRRVTIATHDNALIRAASRHVDLSERRKTESLLT